MVVEKITFDKFKKETNDEEGLVMTGCGGDAQDWIDGITQKLNDDKIASGNVEKLWKNIFILKTTGGRIDIAFVSHNCLKDFNVGKMAIWRLKMGGCSWISDYLVNYANHFKSN